MPVHRAPDTQIGNAQVIGGEGLGYVGGGGGGEVEGILLALYHYLVTHPEWLEFLALCSLIVLDTFMYWCNLCCVAERLSFMHLFFIFKTITIVYVYIPFSLGFLCM